MDIATVIVAAGRGTRISASAGRVGSEPKQYVPLAGRPVLERTIAAFAACPDLGRILVVIHPDDLALYRAATATWRDRLEPPVYGGATRQQSVLAGLRALGDRPPDTVLIHDAARPAIEIADIEAVATAARMHGGAIAAVPVADTLKRAAPDDGTSRLISETVPRDGLWRAATPQGFRYAAILAAHELAASGQREFTDDAAVAEAAGLAVALVATSSRNFKITTTADLEMMERTMRQDEPLSSPHGSGNGSWPDVRTGSGFDVHKLVPGDHVWLCGIRIAHDARLDGHSDADVGLHALTDALLGAIGDGDIGAHFPPSDPQWKGMASHVFLADAAARVRARGGLITNVDVTLLCEAPRIGPHRDAMRARVAEILSISVARVGIKATTTETLGFTGRREGVAAMATATVLLPGQAGAERRD